MHYATSPHHNPGPLASISQKPYPPCCAAGKKAGPVHRPVHPSQDAFAARTMRDQGQSRPQVAPRIHLTSECARPLCGVPRTGGNPPRPVQQVGRVQTGNPRSNDGNSRVGHILAPCVRQASYGYRYSARRLNCSSSNSFGRVDTTSGQQTENSHQTSSGSEDVKVGLATEFGKKTSLMAYFFY